MRTISVTLLLSLMLLNTALHAQHLEPSLAQAVQTALHKGSAWLVEQQQPPGAWSETNMPALTALPLWALTVTDAKKYATACSRAITFLLQIQQPDGGFYLPTPERPGGGLGNYNTAICIAALHATGQRTATSAILQGRAYIAGSQLGGDDWYTGGFGYDKNAQRRYSDLNNAHYAMDAMRRTQAVEDLRPVGEKRVDINWEAALKYVLQLQNTEGETAGGFAYNTHDPKGGVQTNASGRLMLRAYGSMTYAGLLSMVHARLDKSDPRVRSAVEYATRFWTLSENPGQGAQGLFFYYNVMSRALSAAGLQTLPRPESEGGAIAWQRELVQQLLSRQHADGSWVNDNNRWWENNPVLVTSYSMLALAFGAGLAN